MVVSCRRLTGCIDQQSREGVGQKRVVVVLLCFCKRRRDGSGAGGLVRARGRWEGRGEVRGGGADQCLDGSLYHKNSERVGRCWLGGDGGG